ncbi:MAG TPA: ABC transporter substrate-binding protein [Aestuariivirgaceae bacterium]|nr:ABC transporter substrate-binding protein [Aestuariivirgaceae bacterium]
MFSRPVSTSLLAAAAALWMTSAGALAADMIGNCELSGAKGSHAVANPTQPGQITVAVSLPAPTWWNGDTPDTIKDGMEYCMAAEIAWRAGYDKLEVVNVGWDPLVTGQVKDFDLALSQISITDERKKVVDFSIPYFSSDIGVLAKADAPVDEASIMDKVVGVQEATTGGSFAMETLKLPKVQVYPSQADMFTALAAGQIDVAMTDTSIVLAEELKSPGKLKVVGQYKTGETYGAIYPKESPNKASFDAIIQSMIDDGTMSKLADKYLAAVWGQDPGKVPYFKH